MREGISYTVTLNFVIMFITIFCAFLFAALIYYKSNKVSNIIINSIEKYEGYNDLAVNEINNKITALGYYKHSISCSDTVENGACTIVRKESAKDGYCVYKCLEGDYYYFKVKSNLTINLPVVNELFRFPIYSNTNRLYDFQNNLK